MLSLILFWYKAAVFEQPHRGVGPELDQRAFVPDEPR
jgi:hypothetical protein